MQNKNKITKTDMAVPNLKTQLKLIGCLNRAGMSSGNMGDFDDGIGNLEDALSLAKPLNKECLTAKLLNNIGILYTQSGSWDKAMLAYEKAMRIITEHHGTDNFLYRTLQKNIAGLFGVDKQFNA